LDDHRPHHGDAEGDERRRAGLGELVLEDVALDDAPAGAALLDRPVRRDPAALVQDAVPAQDVLALDLLVLERLAPDVGGQVLLDEAPALGAEGLLLLRVGELHGNPFLLRDVTTP
jgi:hypothetical protein